MKIYLVFVGKTRELYLREGIENFLGRLRRYVQVEVKTVRSERLTRESQATRVVAAESQKVAAAVPRDAHLVVLDRQGKQMSSEGLAYWWQRLEQAGCRKLCFAVGGVLGFSNELRSQAQTLLALSKMTYTHEMSRLILLEQLYRACTIMRGEKYHK
jgi:23S rRNA (pseudouridine1915-N3)-methyltransferase